MIIKMLQVHCKHVLSDQDGGYEAAVYAILVTYLFETTNIEDVLLVDVSNARIQFYQ